MKPTASREAAERKAMYQALEDSPRGLGDVDFYADPNQPQHDIVVLLDNRSFEELLQDAPF